MHLIDPIAFAREARSWSAQLVLGELDARVSAHADLADGGSDAVVQADIRGGIDALQRPFVDITLQAQLALVCQRCLGKVDYPIAEQARVVFFADEAALDEAMHADPDADGMLVEGELDLLSLVEDQLLMAWPLSPVHDVCEHAAAAAVRQDKPNPFAALAGLKTLKESDRSN